MTLAFWYWWVVLLILLPLTFFYKQLLVLVYLCLLMGSIVRIMPNMHPFLQIIVATFLTFVMFFLQHLQTKRKARTLVSCIGLELTVNKSMISHRLVQIDKQKLRLANIETFAVGQRVRIRDVKDNALILEIL